MLGHKKSRFAHLPSKQKSLFNIVGGGGLLLSNLVTNQKFLLKQNHDYFLPTNFPFFVFTISRVLIHRVYNYNTKCESLLRTFGKGLLPLLSGRRLLPHLSRIN